MCGLARKHPRNVGDVGEIGKAGVAGHKAALPHPIGNKTALANPLGKRFGVHCDCVAVLFKERIVQKIGYPETSVGNAVSGHLPTDRLRCGILVRALVPPPVPPVPPCASEELQTRAGAESLGEREELGRLLGVPGPGPLMESFRVAELLCPIEASAFCGL